MRFNRIVLICALILGLSAEVMAQTSPRPLPAKALDLNWLRPTGEAVRSAKLLAPNVGWAASASNIFWTTDDGAKWNDITPPDTLSDCDYCVRDIESVSFIDTRRGWALIDYYSNDRSGTRYPITMASTTDAGKTWSETHFTYRGFDPESFTQNAIKMSFADPRHGWVLMVLQDKSLVLLMTENGGRTWKTAPHTPNVMNDGYDLLLVTSREGWMLSGLDLQRPGESVPTLGTVATSLWTSCAAAPPTERRPGSAPITLFTMSNPRFVGNELYVTHDGARTWEGVSLDVPEELCANLSPRRSPSVYFPVYDLPIFVDQKHGYLRVTYSGGWASIEKAAAVLFATEDGGRSWKPDRFVQNLPSVVSHLRSAVVDSQWLISSHWGGHPTLTKIGAGAKVSSDAEVSGVVSNAYRELSFSTPTQGWSWALPHSGNLLSTSDGGSTWTQINPQVSRSRQLIQDDDSSPKN